MIVRIVILAGLLWASPSARAQASNTDFDGSDGPLILRNPGIVVFDPETIKGRPASSRPDIYHFSSITIGPGVTVKLSGEKVNGPVFWLSQGPVQIDGMLDLDGANGGTRRPAMPGAGGYPGGIQRK